MPIRVSSVLVHSQLRACIAIDRPHNPRVKLISEQSWQQNAMQSYHRSNSDQLHQQADNSTRELVPILITTGSNKK